MYYRRKLPHWQTEGVPLFITWRLAGSIARAAMPRRFSEWDAELDRAAAGPMWLKDKRLAQLVSEAIIYGSINRKWYDLFAWVVMSNHVHIVIQPKIQMARITRWLKGSTAREANRILSRTGEPFWHAESFDHRVRNLQNAIQYVEQNPVSAGIVKRAADYLWSSAGWAGESACPTA